MPIHDLRFLADESCDFAVVRALRSVGYDVVAVSEYSRRVLGKSPEKLSLKFIKKITLRVLNACRYDYSF
jgi:hypothetical protein